ncbi:YadA-like family protein, partial [Variovorax sp. J22P168]|uniref:YadA family autotransporter adhesin n=1 Tax=Variovorax jilinensis TaxID=3053513 RepID=UPI002575D565
GTAGARKLVGVAEGALAADSQEAVNGSQLFATNENVAKNTTDIAGNKTAIDGLDGRVGTAEGNITTIQGDVSTINTNIGAIQGDITNIDGRVTNVEGSVTNLTNNLDNGSVGMVKQAAAGANLTVGANTDGVAVDFADKNGNTRTLKNVTAGKDKFDAVNVGQLMQAGVIDENGQVQEMLAYDAGSNKGTITLGGAGGTQIKNVADGTDDHDAVNLRQLKKTGLIGEDGKTLDAVTYDAGSDRSKVTFGDPSAGAVLLSNVAAGRADTDAANVGQLRGVANALGGGAAVNPDGSVTGPTFVLNNEKYTNIGDALTGLAGDIGKTGDRITVIEKVTSTTQNKGDIAISNSGGPEAVATGKDSVAIGPGATASSDNSVALGAGSTTGNRDNTVSVGSAGNERAIANVADAVMGTDAVNKRQLDSVADSNRAYTDIRANQLEASMDKVKRDSNAAAASAMAVATLPQSIIPGRGMASAALSNMAGESALAVGVSKVDESGRWVTKVSGTVNTRGNAGVSAGIGFHW